MAGCARNQSTVALMSATISGSLRYWMRPGAVVQLLLGKAVEQVGRDGSEPGFGQLVGHVADELVHAAPVLAHNHRRKRPAASAAGDAGVDVHIFAVHLYGFPK